MLLISMLLVIQLVWWLHSAFEVPGIPAYRKTFLRFFSVRVDAMKEILNDEKTLETYQMEEEKNIRN